jgi:hypothetical protein
VISGQRVAAMKDYTATHVDAATERSCGEATTDALRR